MPEQSRYIRGLRTWIGFKQIGIEYERDARVEGVSKYSFSMLLKLASEGIFNFSQFPIKFITRLGFSTIMLASIYLVTVLFKRLFFNTVPEGFTALLIAIIMFSGVILFSIGVIGEYILRIFFEVKRRPLTIVSEEIKHGKIIQS
jgi:dolichol-phosphate mannosyltransferase